MILPLKQYGVSVPGGCCIDIHFTHSDVASMVNTSRVTVSNIFTWLAENGYLHRQERFFVVDSVERLEELAQEGIDLEQYMKNRRKAPDQFTVSCGYSPPDCKIWLFPGTSADPLPPSAPLCCIRKNARKYLPKC